MPRWNWTRLASKTNAPLADKLALLVVMSPAAAVRPFGTVYMQMLAAAEGAGLFPYLFGSGAFLPELERWQRFVPLWPLSRLKALFFRQVRSNPYRHLHLHHAHVHAT